MSTKPGPGHKCRLVQGFPDDYVLFCSTNASKRNSDSSPYCSFAAIQTLNRLRSRIILAGHKNGHILVTNAKITSIERAFREERVGFEPVSRGTSGAIKGCHWKLLRGEIAPMSRRRLVEVATDGNRMATAGVSNPSSTTAGDSFAVLLLRERCALDRIPGQ